MPPHVAYKHTPLWDGKEVFCVVICRVRAFWSWMPCAVLFRPPGAPLGVRVLVFRSGVFFSLLEAWCSGFGGTPPLCSGRVGRDKQAERRAVLFY